MKKFIISLMLMLTIYVIESKTLGEIIIHRLCINGYEYVAAEKESPNSTPSLIQSYENAKSITFKYRDQSLKDIVIPKECLPEE